MNCWKVWYLPLLFFCYFSGCCCNTNNKNLESFPCQNCSSSVKSNLRIKSFNVIDKTSSIIGCFMDGTMGKTDNRNYEEFHIIVLRNTISNQVYIDIQDKLSNSLPHSVDTTIKGKYTLVFLSDSSLDLLISYDSNDADYEFYVSSQSTLKSSVTASPLPFKTLGSTLGAPSENLYNPLQLKVKLCSELFQSDVCDVNSFLQLDAVNSMQIAIGNLNSTGLNNKDRSCLPLRNISDTTRVKAFQYLPMSPIEEYVSDLPAIPPYLFIVDLANCTGSKIPVKLNLDGVSALSAEQQVVIVLRSNVPVKWTVSRCGGKDVAARVRFAISNGSVVHFDRVQSSSDKASLLIERLPRSLSEGACKSLLETAPSVFRIPVKAYSRLLNSPNLIKITYRDEFPETSAKPPQDIEMILHSGIFVNSSGNYLRLNENTLQGFGLEIADIVVGNGSCNSEPENDDDLVIGDLSDCGLKRTTIDYFEMPVTVKGRRTTVQFHFPIRKPAIQLYDGLTKKQLTSPVNASAALVVQINASASDKHEVNTMLEECYLFSYNSSAKRLLVKDNFPTANGAVRVSSSGPCRAHSRSRNFTFTPGNLLPLSDHDLIAVTCVLTRCFSVRNPSSSLLPSCFGGTVNKQSAFNESVSVEVFISGPSNEEVIPITLIVLLATVSFFLAIALFVLCRLFAMKHFSPSKLSFSHSKSRSNGLIRPEVRLEMNHTDANSNSHPPKHTKTNNHSSHSDRLLTYAHKPVDCDRSPDAVSQTSLEHLSLLHTSPATSESGSNEGDTKTFAELG